MHLGRTPLGCLRASKQPKRSCDVTLERAGDLLAALGSSREPVSGDLVPDPAVAPWVRRAFAMRASGARLVEVVDMLNREAPRPGGRLWPTRTSTDAPPARVPGRGGPGRPRRARRTRIARGRGDVRGGAGPFARPVASERDRRVPPARPDPLRGVRLPDGGCNQPCTRASGAVDRVDVVSVRRAAGWRGLRAAGASTAWSELTATEQFEVLREALDAVVVRESRGRREPVAARTSLYRTGTVEHLLPCATNGWELRPLGFAAAAALTEASTASRSRPVQGVGR